MEFNFLSYCTSQNQNNETIIYHQFILFLGVNILLTHDVIVYIWINFDILLKTLYINI